MSWGLVAVAGATLVGGVMSSQAAKGAAQTQADAANAASRAQLGSTASTNAMLQQQYNQNLQNQSPWLNAGGQALAALEGGLGLSNPFANATGITNTSTGNTGVVGPSGPNMSTQPVQPGMSTQAVMGGNTMQGTNVLPGGSVNGPPSVNTGVVSPTNVPTNQGTLGLNGVITPNSTGSTNYGATSGQTTSAFNSQQTNGVGNFTKTFAPSDLTLDPSYQWRLQQGQKALEASAAAKGLGGSGQNLKDLTDYSQGAASQEYQAAYDRFMNTQNTQYNRLAVLAGVGQATASGLGSQGASTAGNIASNTQAGTAASNNYLTGGAAASAAGQVGSANAYSGAIGNIANTWMGSQYLNKVGSTPSSTGTGYVPGVTGQTSYAPANYSIGP